MSLSDTFERHLERKKNKHVLDREEKKLGKIADKNPNIERDLKTKALRKRK